MREEVRPCPFCGGKAYLHVEDTLFIECWECHASGPDKKTPDEAIAAWNALPRHFRWTKTPPTEPGYYWNREPDELRGCVVEVFEQDGKLYVFYPGNEVEEEISENDEWVGPLEMPLDDKRSTK